MADWIGVYGRLHPMLVHLPIGLLLALFLLEAAADAAGAALPRKVVSVLAWMAAVSAVLAATAGYTLSREDGYGGRTLDLHLRYGLAIAACALVTATLHLWARDGTRSAGMRMYRLMLLLSVILLVPAGHLGSTIAHGEGFVTEPLRTDVRADLVANRGRGPREVVQAAEKGAATAAAAAKDGESEPKPEPKSPPSVSYVNDIAPVLSARCGACHGESKRKGGLSLTNAAELQEGGWEGPVIVAGNPAESELVRRLQLPIDHEDHMPPSSKPQPTAAEIAVLEKWIAMGAPFDQAASAPESTEPTEEGTSLGADGEPRQDAGSGAAKRSGGGMEAGGSVAIPPVAAETLATLRENRVEVEEIARGSHFLYVDFAAVAATTDDAQVARLLEPVLAQTVDLSLAKAQIGDAALKTAAKMPNLSRLDLRETAVTDAGLACLVGHSRLAELVLPRTRLTDASVKHLLKMPSLARVFLWNSGISIRGIAELRTGRPDLVIEAGYPVDAKALVNDRGSR